MESALLFSVGFEVFTSGISASKRITETLLLPEKEDIPLKGNKNKPIVLK